jgi:hypothetical protein
MKKFLTIALVLLLFSGCNKELGVYPLNEMKNQNPWTGNEELKYLTGDQDTVLLIGQGRFTEEIKSPYNGSGNRRYYMNEDDNSWS